jgi:hypothetical protein
MEVLVYSSFHSNRLVYSLKYTLSELLGFEFQVTQDIAYFAQYNGPRINYSKSGIPGSLQVEPVGLLSETGLSPFFPETENKNGTVVLFPARANPLAFFDVFSAIFYMITRYEEHLPYTGDELGRFMPEDSIAFREGFLDEPVVNQWSLLLLSRMKDLWPDLKYKLPAFRFVPTYDVDNAYAWLGKGVLHNAASVLKNLFAGKPAQVVERIRVLRRKVADPYDSYDYILKCYSRTKVKPVFFILFGSKTRFDKNMSPSNKAFRRLLNFLTQSASIGMHPSYGSNFLDSIKEEKQALEKATRRNIIMSRQHFLMVKFPDTYIRLVRHGLLEDYSLGYAHFPGFRSGTTVPYNYYSLTKEKITGLKMYPLMFMDRTLHSYLKLSPDQAAEVISTFIEKVRKVGGTFVSLWHNESLGSDKQWEGWRAVHEEMIRKATKP